MIDGLEYIVAFILPPFTTELLPAQLLSQGDIGNTCRRGGI